MTSILKELVFDKALVRKIKKAKPAEAVLYRELISGKITLQEYLAAL